MAQEGVARLGGLRLVGHAPERQGAAVLVARDHFADHAPGLLPGLAVGEVDALPDGNLLPEQEAHLLGQPNDVFVLGVVGQADHVAAEGTGFRKQHHGVRLGEGPAHALRDLLVETDGLEEQRRAVEADVLALDPDVAEADPLLHPVAVRGDDHPVAFRICRGPAFEFLHPERHRGRALVVRDGGFANVQFRDFDPDGSARCRAGQLHVGRDPVGGILVEADEIVLDEGVRDAD